MNLTPSFTVVGMKCRGLAMKTDDVFSCERRIITYRSTLKKRTAAGALLNTAAENIYVWSSAVFFK